MRVHKGPNVTTAERDLVVKWTKRCLRELAKKEHELVDFHLRPQTVASLQRSLMVNVKARNQRSNGGRNQITIDVRDAQIRGKRERFGEYKAYASDPVIGDITIFDQEQGTVHVVGEGVECPERAVLDVVQEQVVHELEGEASDEVLSRSVREVQVEVVGVDGLADEATVVEHLICWMVSDDRRHSILKLDSGALGLVCEPEELLLEDITIFTLNLARDPLLK